MIESLKYNPELKERKELKIESGHFSVADERRLEHNEDAVLEDRENNVFGVFDGVGGGPAGGEASLWVAEKTAVLLREGKDIKTALVITHQELNSRGVIEKGEHMATTATVVKILPIEAKALIGNVGDSRAYLIRAGKIRKLTVDDNYIPEELQQSLDDALDLKDLKDNERMLFKIRHRISDAVGGERMEPKISQIDIQASDRIVLLSDGVSDNLTTQEILDNVMVSSNPDEATLVLVTAAQERSRDESHFRHKPDDMTALIINC